MEKADLLKYLNDCRDLELTYHNQCNEQGKLKQRVASMGIAERIFEPKKKEVSRIIDDDVASKVSLITGIIIGLLFGILVAISFRKPIDGIAPGIVAGIIAGIVVSFITMSIIVYFIEPILTRLATNEQYEIACQNYQLAVQRDNERVNNENRQIPIIQSRINDLEAQKKATSEALVKLYALGIIYPKYQALVPVVMFCEYIESGRCSQLEGHEGAYNIYESELRQNVIITKLNDVINQLEQIKDNQWMLYTAIERGNQKVDQLCSATYESAKRLEGIQNNAAISAENSKITAQNTRILAEIETYRLLTDK